MGHNETDANLKVLFRCLQFQAIHWCMLKGNFFSYYYYALGLFAACIEKLYLSLRVDSTYKYVKYHPTLYYIYKRAFIRARPLECQSKVTQWKCQTHKVKQSNKDC